MLNVLLQLSTFVYGLLLNFLAPVAYGLSEYGEFIAQQAWVLLIYRVMYIIGEPLIRFTRPRQLLANLLVLHALVLVLFMAASALGMPGSVGFMGALLLNLSVLYAMQAVRRRRAYVLLLSLMSGIFAGLALWSQLGGGGMALVDVMALSAGLPGLLGTVYLFLNGAEVPRLSHVRRNLRRVLRLMPRLVTMTGAMNMLSSALPVFLAPVLSARDMGLFKVMTSIIQAATSVFPVSTQTVLASFARHPRGAEFYRTLSSIAMLYFSLAMMALVLVALLQPSLAPYVMLAACLPAYYQAILTERHMIASRQLRVLMGINLLVVVVIALLVLWVDDLAAAALVYAGGIMLYALLLSVMDRTLPPMLLLMVLIGLCPAVAFAMMEGHLIAGLFYGALVMVVALLRHRPTVAEVKLLWREM